MEVVGEVKGRHGLGAEWRDTWASRVMIVDRRSGVRVDSSFVTCGRTILFSTGRLMVMSDAFSSGVVIPYSYGDMIYFPPHVARRRYVMLCHPSRTNPPTVTELHFQKARNGF